VRRIRLTVQYDGARYHGLQSQCDRPTVQLRLEQAIEHFLGCFVRVHAAGRTDAGVHALAMPVRIDIDHPIPAGNLPFVLNARLPDDISVLEAIDVAPDFEVRRHALIRWYRYQVRLSTLREPLGARAWRINRPLNLAAMAPALAMLEGDHDFSGFRSSECQAKRTLLTLQQARMTEHDDMLVFDFKCRSFLHHMIRFVVGTMVSLGYGKIDVPRLLRILDDGQRPQLILCAPPHALCLMAVGYTEAEQQAILAANPAPPSF
jgi:tRNA pseudouridine38-40 synthase